MQDKRSAISTLPRYEIDLRNGDWEQKLVVEGGDLEDAKARARRHIGMRTREGGWIAVGGRPTKKPLLKDLIKGKR